MRKLLVLVLALCMLVSALPSCVIAEGYEKHVTINYAFVQGTEGTNFNDGDPLARYFTEKFNFQWEPIYLTYDNWASNLRIWINSGDMPDMVQWDYINSEAMDYVSQGLVRRMPDDWQERWPNIAARYNASDLGPALDKILDGAYFLPHVVYADHSPTEKRVSNSAIYIRKDWAQEVGFPLKDAYTITELMEYARLIKEKDPGKLGDKLIPMSLDNTACTMLFIARNSAYINGSTAMFLKNDEGQYIWGPMDKGVLEGLKLWQQAFREGLIHPEFFTFRNIEDQEEFYIAGTAGLAFYEGHAMWMSRTDGFVKDNLNLNYDDVVHTAIVLGEDGLHHEPRIANYWTVTMFNPELDDETFERAMDVIDYSASEEGQRYIRLGFENEDFAYAEDGSIIDLNAGVTTLQQKYLCIVPIYNTMLVQPDDFMAINPTIKEEHRERYMTLFGLKEKLGNETTLPEIDWMCYFYNSPNMSKVNNAVSAELAELVVMDGDLEENFKKWLESKMPIIQPVLDELNAQ